MPRHLFSLLLLLISGCFFSCGEKDIPTANNVHVRLAGNPDGLNPLLVHNGFAGQITKQLFQPLFEFDPETLELYPVLAKAVPEKKVIDTGAFKGGVAYTFEIRENARWGNDTPILASDYVFTFKSIFNPHLPTFFRSYLNFFKTVEIDPSDPRKFTVITDQSYFMAEVILGNIELLPEYFYDPEGVLRSFDFLQLTEEEEAEKLNNNEALKSLAEYIQQTHRAHDPQLINGSGPYQVVEWQTGQFLELEKKKSWWGAAIKDQHFTAIPQTIRYSMIPDANAAISLLKSGELDVMSGIPPRQYIELQKDDYLVNHYNWFSPSQLSYIYIALNRKNPKLEEVKVRQALAHVLPLDQIIDQAMYGLAKKTIGPFSPESPYYNEQLSPISMQLDRAKELLKEAGWEDTNDNGIVDKKINGQQVELTLRLDRTSRNEGSQSVALLLKENARKVGIDIEIQSLEHSKLSDRLRKRDFEMAYTKRGYAPGESDPSQTWCSGKDYGGITNYSGFGNAQSDQLIDEIRTSLDQKERYDKYRQLQAMIYEDQPVLFIAVPQSTIAIHKRFSAKVSQRWPGYFPERFLSTNQD